MYHIIKHGLTWSRVHIRSWLFVTDFFRQENLRKLLSAFSWLISWWQCLICIIFLGCDDPWGRRIKTTPEQVRRLAWSAILSVIRCSGRRRFFVSHKWDAVNGKSYVVVKEKIFLPVLSQSFAVRLGSFFFNLQRRITCWFDTAILLTPMALQKFFNFGWTHFNLD